MAEKDSRTYIRVHDGMPDHPKVEPLSDAAFRLLVTTWCWNSRYLTDGHVPAATRAKRGKAKVWDELIDAGLVDVYEDGSLMMHHYTEHQRTAEEVQAIRDARAGSGALGNHKRWHVGRGITDPECDHCSDPERIPNGSQTRSQMDRETSPQTQAQSEVTTKRARATRGTTIPDDWRPKDDHLKIATEYGLDPAFELRSFRDYYEATGKTHKNWDAGFRTWLNKSKSFKTPAYSAPSPVARKHLPETAPDVDPDDFEGYAAALRGEVG